MEKSQSKEYGKLSLDELKRLLEAITIPKLGELDITKRLPPIPDSKLNELAVAGYAGTWLYELPLLTHLAVLVYAFGLRRRLAGWVKQQNPQRAVLDFMNHGSMPPTGKSRKTNMTALRFIATWTLTRELLSNLVYSIPNASHEDQAARFC